MVLGTSASLVRHQVIQGCPDDDRVILHVPQPQVAVPAQDAAQALPAGPLPPRTAGVVMVDVPAAGRLGTRLAGPADLAAAPLGLEHGLELLGRDPVLGQPVSRLVRRLRIALVVIPHVLRLAWPAVSARDGKRSTRQHPGAFATPALRCRRPDGQNSDLATLRLAVGGAPVALAATANSVGEGNPALGTVLLREDRRLGLVPDAILVVPPGTAKRRAVELRVPASGRRKRATASPACTFHVTHNFIVQHPTHRLDVRLSREG